MKMRFILLAAASAMTVSLGFAAVPIPCGWYLEGNVGPSSATNFNFGNGSRTSSSGVGFNINAGYKMMPFFAAEVGYTQYKKVNVQIANETVATDQPTSYDIAAKGILPFVDSSVEIFAKVGVAQLNSKLSVKDADDFVGGISPVASTAISNRGTKHTTGWYLGLGGDYSYTPCIPIILQWQRAGSSNGDLNLYSLGIAYIFG